jgi:preprotein translocase subunit SecA
MSLVYRLAAAVLLVGVRASPAQSVTAAEFAARYRPELRQAERSLILEILDTAWKDHLLVMDHLRDSVGMRGYAQVDPKVEYKREGMRTFEQMWDTVGERTTDLIFRMEQLDEGFVGSTWTWAEARNESAPPPSEIAGQQPNRAPAPPLIQQHDGPGRSRTFQH